MQGYWCWYSSPALPFWEDHDLPRANRAQDVSIVVAALRFSLSGLAENEPLSLCKGDNIGTPSSIPTLTFGGTLPRADKAQHVSSNENSFL